MCLYVWSRHFQQITYLYVQSIYIHMFLCIHSRYVYLQNTYTYVYTQYELCIACKAHTALYTCECVFCTYIYRLHIYTHMCICVYVFYMYIHTCIYVCMYSVHKYTDCVHTEIYVRKRFLTASLSTFSLYVCVWERERESTRKRDRLVRKETYKWLYSAKETYNFKEPINRDHPIYAQEWRNRTLISHEPLVCSKMCFSKTEPVQS